MSFVDQFRLKADNDFPKNIQLYAQTIQEFLSSPVFRPPVQLQGMFVPFPLRESGP